MLETTVYCIIPSTRSSHLITTRFIILEMSYMFLVPFISLHQDCTPLRAKAPVITFTISGQDFYWLIIIVTLLIFGYLYR